MKIPRTGGWGFHFSGFNVLKVGLARLLIVRQRSAIPCKAHDRKCRSLVTRTGRVCSASSDSSRAISRIVWNEISWASHPFRRKTRNGWGTEVYSQNALASGGSWKTRRLGFLKLRRVGVLRTSQVGEFAAVALTFPAFGPSGWQRPSGRRAEDWFR